MLKCSPQGWNSTNLDGEDLHSHMFIQQLGLPDTTKAPPGFHLDQLQGFVSQNRGRGRGSRILQGGRKRKVQQPESHTVIVLLYIQPVLEGC